MDHLGPRRALAALVAVGLLAGSAPAAARPSKKDRARVATRFLADQQKKNGSISQFSPLGDTADAVAAFALARRGPRQIERGLGYLEKHLDDADSIGLVAKVVMAVAASGGDPRDFGGRDLVQEIRDSETPEGQLGGESDAEVTYHALAMLALGAAGELANEQNAAWLSAAQCRDGGWQFDEPATAQDDEHCRDDSAGTDFAGSDTNTTSYAVQAFRVASGIDWVYDPYEFFDSARDPYKKGFVYDPSQKCTEETLGTGCFLTDANSTALGIQGMLALERGYARPARALRRLQYRLCGKNGGAVAFSWDYDPDTGRFSKQAPSVGSTIAAIPALLGHTFPFDPRVPHKPPPRRVPCG